MTRPLCRFQVICDWHEVWTQDYWRQYLGTVAGKAGWLIQRLCARVPQQAYTFSRLHARRLEAHGLRGSTRILSGEYAGNVTVPRAVPPQDPPLVVYAGRMIPEKRVTLLVDAIDIARRSIPHLHAVLFGKGPELERIRARIDELRLTDAISLPGFASADEVAATMARSLCVVQPSSREGYGMIVVEASASGVPAVVIDGENNAATELIEPGHNGFIASIPKPDALAEQIVRCWRAGDALRNTTREWYGRNAARLSLEGSLEEVIRGYRTERSSHHA